MERGEPPGKDLVDAGQSDERSSKPVRINVQVDFRENDTGIVARSSPGMLRRPLNNLFHEATVRLENKEGSDRPVKRTIGLFQGMTVQRVNGHVRYSSILSASPETLETVRENIAEGLRAMQKQYRGGLENVLVHVEEPAATQASTDAGATVELNHADPVGNDERGEGDRDGVGARAVEA